MRVYQLINSSGVCVYVGVTRKLLHKRWNAYALKKRFGTDELRIELLEECASEELMWRAEQRHIKLLRPTHNLSTGGKGGPTGVKLSPQRKAQISIQLQGNQHTKGKSLSEEHKLKLSVFFKGRPKSEEHKRKIGAAHRGKFVSAETCAKISAAKRKGAV